MAYVGKVSIRCDEHLEKAVQYIANEDKALSLNEYNNEIKNRLEHISGIEENLGERATFINCSATNTFKEFENMRKTFNQNHGLLAHHYYQSFSPSDEVTPEKVHQLGVELAEKMFVNFQVAIATHIDKEHLHNHFLVNSCNIKTGQKWYSHKQSLNDIRKESDKLCLKNGLSIIDKNSKYKGIDRTTYQLGTKCKSWKINLLKDLDEAMEHCKSKEDFISFLVKRDYTVRYKDVHITITKNGEKKGIRVDTLARQFGEKYCKENLEKKMGYFVPIPQDIIEKYKPSEKEKRTNRVKSNWEHFEQRTFRQRNYPKSTINNIQRKDKMLSLLYTTQRSVMYSNTPQLFFVRLIFLIMLLSMKKKPKKRFKRIETFKLDNSCLNRFTSVGNVEYNLLTQSAGDNYSIKVNLPHLMKIINQPILYSARIDNDKATATITVKEKDKAFLAKLLDFETIQAQLEQQNEAIQNRAIYHELKHIAEENGTKLDYLMVNQEQLNVLKQNYIDMAYFAKGEKFNISFLPEKKELIQKLLSPPVSKTETEKQKNNRIYAELKKLAAQKNEKLSFKLKLTSEQLRTLSESDIRFAYFTNSDDNSLFNIAFEKSNIERVNETLNRAKKINR